MLDSVLPYQMPDDCAEIEKLMVQTADVLTDSDAKDEKQRFKAAQEAAAKLMPKLFGEGKASEQRFFCYLLVEVFQRPNINRKLMGDFIQCLFPTMLNKRQAHVASIAISLGLSLRFGPLLDCLEYYVRTSDTIEFPTGPVAESLAQDSPTFCAALISRGYFLLHSQSKQYLNNWLKALVDVIPDHSINLQKAIRFSFLDCPADLELHLAILRLIQQRKCEPLSNASFIIDLATSISNQNNNLLIDRFAQVLIVGNAGEMCSLSNQLKGILLNKFPDHHLIKAVCK